MRHRDLNACLSDALAAAQTIERFIGSKSFEQYQADDLLRSGVERQFEIVGEALNRALKTDPGLPARIPKAPSIVAFRNVLAHGYDAVVDETVFAIATHDVPSLVAQLRVLLEEF